MRPSDVISAVRLLARQTHVPVSFEGTVVPDSWNAQAGTVDVLIGDTAGYTDDDSENPLVLQGVPLSTPAYGFQHGPVGGERATVVTAGGSDWRASIDYDEDDSPGTPAGEHWWVRFALGLADLTVQSFVKHTKDGESQGDAKGGLRLGSAFVSIVTSLLMLGAEGLDKTKRAAIAKEDLDNALASYTQSVIAPLCARLQSGSGVPPPTGKATTSGSSIVKIAP